MNNKNKLIRTKGGKKSIFSGINIEILIAVILVVVIAVVTFVLIRIEKNNIPNVAQPKPTRAELYEQYVGPMTCEMQGEWVDIKDFYELFNDDHKELDLNAALFKQEKLRGIVPTGVRLEAVMLSYDDFEPYKSPLDKGFLDIYSCKDVGETELQLAASFKDIGLEGGYNIDKDGKLYSGNINLKITDAEYYMLDTFVPGNVGVLEGYGETNGFSDLGFLTPHFDFKYILNGAAKVQDSPDAEVFEINIVGQGSLSDGTWQYTSDLVGQGMGVFKNGEVYIRCKLPCLVSKTENGQTVQDNSFVNVYFKINQVRIGTWADCMPKSR